MSDNRGWLISDSSSPYNYFHLNNRKEMEEICNTRTELDLQCNMCIAYKEGMCTYKNESVKSFKQIL